MDDLFKKLDQLSNSSDGSEENEEMIKDCGSPLSADEESTRNNDVNAEPLRPAEEGGSSDSSSFGSLVAPETELSSNSDNESQINSNPELTKQDVDPNNSECHPQAPVLRIQVPKKERLEAKAEYTRLPGYIRIASEIFDEETFENDIGDLPEDIEMHHLVATSVLTKNTVRWRRAENGNLESNAKILTWDNGTRSLMIGDVLFDIKPAINPSNNRIFVNMDDYHLGCTIPSTRILLNAVKMDYNTMAQVNQSLREIREGKKKEVEPLIDDTRDPEIVRLEQIRKTEEILKAEEKRRNAQLRRREVAARRANKMAVEFLEEDSNDELKKDWEGSENDTDLFEGTNANASDVDESDKKRGGRVVRIEESDED
ncbi:hypothetical protein ACOME3_000793 [Neoechinorhynchus agilis]